MSQIINGGEVDVVTGAALIQVKRTCSAIERSDNFLNKATRNQIKVTIEIAVEQGKRTEFWFKHGVCSKVRMCIEDKGGVVKVGLGGVMSSYVSVRGWIECDFKDVPTIKNLAAGSWASFGKHGLESDAADLYWSGWVFPEIPINWVAFVFYGGVINSRAYDFFKFVLDEVAKANVEIEGLFYVDFEEGDDSRVLRVESGVLLERKR